MLRITGISLKDSDGEVLTSKTITRELDEGDSKSFKIHLYLTVHPELIVSKIGLVIEAWDD